MIKFTDYIDPTAFFIALGIGILITYVFATPKKIIIKWPTPENAGKVIYKDNDENCYKYKANEVPCPDDTTQIKDVSVA